MAGRGKHNADLVLVLALASGLTNRQAAERAGISERTVARRLADPEFQRQISEAKAATLSQTVAQLTAAGLAAVTTLVRLLDADSESAQLGAARSILELGTKLRESYELEQRITALEAQAAQSTTPQRGARWGA